MTDYYKNRKYYVYRHVVPNGKMYIGITSKSEPQQRWGTGGIQYKKNLHFWRAIQKYGWDNIKHIVVAHGLSVTSACNLETYLIKKYNALVNGYNQTSGGVYPTEVSDDLRSLLRERTLAYHATLPKGVWSAKFIGHSVSDATKYKISQKHKGQKRSKSSVDKSVETFRKHLTPELRYKMGSANRGKHLSESTKAKLSATRIGSTMSDTTRNKLSVSLKTTYANSDRIWVHTDSNECWIDKAHLDTYLSRGYIEGRTNIKDKYVSKNGVTIKISNSELNTYILNGWTEGFTADRHNHISKSKQKYIYTYMGIEFDTGKALAGYLRDNGYPKIVQGTVNLICQGQYIAAYPQLSYEIQRRVRNENK